ncbi:MAG: DUF3418 domain-containing protein, partial [Propionibacteriaceae bacterium]|nr:DUF3418 domain-containing protein [Propionibacteriaceae bacterium]
TAAALRDAHRKALTQLVHGYGDPARVRDEAAYDALALQVRQEQADQTRRVVATAALALQTVREVRGKLDGIARSHPAYADITAQLAELIFPGFIAEVRDPWFSGLPRYLKAALLRLETLHANPALDGPRMAQVDEMRDVYAELLDALPPGHPVPDEVDDIGWLIEEFRVQVFAQRLGTAMPVSEKRLRRVVSQLLTTLV